MADENPNLDVRATMDSTGVESGAQKASQAIKSVADETKVAAEASEKATEASQKETAAKKQSAEASESEAVEANAKAAATDKASKSTAQSAEALRFAGQAQAQSAESIAKQTAATGTLTARLEELGVIGPKALTDVNVATSTYGQTAQEATRQSEDSAEAAKMMTEAMKEHQQQLMKNVFAVHRLAEGFKDLSMGGRAAGQGLMDISESLQYVVAPELAIYVVMAQVVGMLAVMATGHRHAGEEAKEHAESEKGLAEQLDKTTQSIMDASEAATKVHYEVITTQLKGVFDVQKALIDQQKEMDEHAGKRLAYIQNETKAHQELTLALMKQQEQRDLNAATSDEQRAVITADYKRNETAMKGGNVQEANMAEQNLLAQQKQADDDQRALYLKVNAANDALIKKYKDDADAKTQRAIDSGFTPNEAGEFTDKQIKEQQEKVKTATAAAQAANNITSRDVLEGPEHLEQKRQQAATATATAGDESRKLADLTEAKASRDMFNANMKQWQENVASNSKAILDLTNKLDEIYSKQRTVSDESKTEASNTTTEQLANDADADKAKADLAWKAWQEAIKRSTENRKEDAAKSEAPMEKEIQSARDKLDQDQGALAQYQANVREIAAHTVTAAHLGKQHAEQTSQATQATREAVAAMHDAILRDQEQLKKLQDDLRNFKQSQKTNAQN